MHKKDKINTLTWGLVPFAQFGNAIGWFSIAFSINDPAAPIASVIIGGFLAFTIRDSAMKITNKIIKE